MAVEESSEQSDEAGWARRIIHIDMDCFYAAVEVRDHPWLAGKPVAVGGGKRRGVVTTCTYEARARGVRSAMPGFKARELCPELIFVPLRFEVYEEASSRVREVLAGYGGEVEPLSLDEAYVDVSHRAELPWDLAAQMRREIYEVTGGLSASAGIGPNKLLAKIASDWNKPDGQFEVREEEVAGFLEGLPVRRLWGVGTRMEEKLGALGIRTCGELRAMAMEELIVNFGRAGLGLWEQARGIDRRRVSGKRERKSLSKERTYADDLGSRDEILGALREIYRELKGELEGREWPGEVRSLILKMRFSDFVSTTVEVATGRLDGERVPDLVEEGLRRGAGRGVRLLGLGVRFRPRRSEGGAGQGWLFPEFGEGVENLCGWYPPAVGTREQGEG